MILKYDVVTIGSAIRDNFFEADFPVTKWSRSPSNKALVLPLGEKLGAKSAYFTIGGNAVNAATTFAKNDWKTAILARVGDDAGGREIVSELKERKIEAGLMEFDSRRPTSSSVIFVRQGERAIVNYVGAGHSLSLESIKINRAKSRWWYVSLPGESYRLFPRLMDIAEKNGISVAFNPTGYHILKDKKNIIKFARKTAVFIANESEAAALTGIPFKKRNALFGKMEEIVRGIVVITYGGKGASVSDGKFIYRAGTFPIRVVDRTGAGDAFGAGFVSSLMKAGYPKKGAYRSKDIEQAIRFASENASSVISRLGGGGGVTSEKKFNGGRKDKLTVKISRL
jgi:sugar/nucleoside kinase (ribokinase family)